MIRRLIRNTLIVSLTSVFVSVFNFFVVGVLVSKIGVVGYGLISLLLLLTLRRGFVSVLTFGIKSPIVKFVSQYASQKDYIRLGNVSSTSFSVLIAWGALVSISFVLFRRQILSLLRLGDMPVAFEVAMTVFFCHYVVQFVDWFFVSLFEGLQRYDVTKSIDVLSAILESLLFLFIAYKGLGSYWYVYSLLCVMYFRLLTLYFSYRRLGFLRLRFLIDLQSLISILGMVKYGIFMTISSFIYNFLPNLLIVSFLQIKDLGVYSIATKVSKFIKTLLGFVNSAVLPAASEFQTVGKFYINRSLFVLGVKLQLFIAVSIVSFFISFGRDFLFWWIGPEAPTIYPYLVLSLIWNLLFPYLTFGGPILLGMNRELKFMTTISWSITIISALFSLLFLYLGGGLFGIMLGRLLGFIVLPYGIYRYCAIFDINVKRFIVDAVVKIYIPWLFLLPFLFFVRMWSSLLLPWQLVLVFFMWHLVYGVSLYLLSLSQDEKAMIRHSFA